MFPFYYSGSRVGDLCGPRRAKSAMKCGKEEICLCSPTLGFGVLHIRVVLLRLSDNKGSGVKQKMKWFDY